MPKVKAKFTQADVAKVIRAVVQTGAQMSVEITPDGVIRIVPTKVSEPPQPTYIKPKSLL